MTKQDTTQCSSARGQLRGVHRGGATLLSRTSPRTPPRPLGPWGWVHRQATGVGTGGHNLPTHQGQQVILSNPILGTCFLGSHPKDGLVSKSITWRCRDPEMGSGDRVQGWKADSEKCSCDFPGLTQPSQEGPGVPPEHSFAGQYSQAKPPCG